MKVLNKMVETVCCRSLGCWALFAHVFSALIAIKKTLWALVI
jgi:hypothetical protein